MIASYSEQSGISIKVWKPTIVAATSYVPKGTLIPGEWAQVMSSYSHDIQANGGWWSASIVLNGELVDMEDWFAEGINRHVEVHNSANVLIFAGFVNQVDLSAGTLSATRGPLMDVVNRVSVTYTPIIDATTTPPIQGTQTTTTIAGDATSQGKYAILEDVVEGGALLDDGVTDDAAQLRDTYLQEFKDPESSEDLNLGGGGSVPSVTLSVLGYVHRFQKYVMQDVTAATTTITTKIQNAINADPNGLFSTDFSKIATNAFLTSRYEDDNRMAWDVMQELVSIGDVNNDRYTLGVYANQQVAYAVLPDSAAYKHRIADGNIEVLTFMGDAIVEPWDVLPARWIFLPDFLTGRSLPAALRDDPRYIFIESVRYTAPNALQISGNKVGTVAQMLAKKGMWS